MINGSLNIIKIDSVMDIAHEGSFLGKHLLNNSLGNTINTSDIFAKFSEDFVEMIITVELFFVLKGIEISICVINCIELAIFV